MHRKIIITLPQIVSIVLITVLFTTISVLAASGTTDSTNAPGLTASYTLEDIYQRLLNGTDGSQSTFNEPGQPSGSGSMHDLNDIMNAAPLQDNTQGALADHVVSGTTFWGLSNSEWGLQSGSIPSGSNITGADGILTFDIPNGVYSGKTASAADHDLLAENILASANIFGVHGEIYGGCTCEGTLIGTRWCDNGDGTITDMLGYNTYGKCLAWLKDAGCLGKKSWSGDDNALLTTAFLNSSSCGLSDDSNNGDWRLPTYTEFYGLLNGTEPVSDSSPGQFINISSSRYWSSRGNGSAGIWAYAFDPQTGNAVITDRVEAHNIWPVRSTP